MEEKIAIQHTTPGNVGAQITTMKVDRETNRWETSDVDRYC